MKRILPKRCHNHHKDIEKEALSMTSIIPLNHSFMRVCGQARGKTMMWNIARGISASFNVLLPLANWLGKKIFPNRVSCTLFTHHLVFLPRRCQKCLCVFFIAPAFPLFLTTPFLRTSQKNPKKGRSLKNCKYCADKKNPKKEEAWIFCAFFSLAFSQRKLLFFVPIFRIMCA